MTFVVREFLDYHVPVFAALDSLVGGGLHVIYSSDAVPKRVQKKISAALGSRAIGLSGEIVFGTRTTSEFANSGVRIPYKKGLVSVIRFSKPDVLIAEGFFQWSFAALLYRLTAGIPLVVCYERTFHTERNAQRYRLLYRRLALRLVDAMCVNGGFALSYAQCLGMPASRITLGYMAADTDDLARRAAAVTPCQREEIRRSWSAQGVVFTYVGRLIPLKGVKDLLRGWAIFEKCRRGLGTLVIVGDGPDRQALERQASDSGLQFVRFCGAVDYDNIAPCYAASDVLTMPTLEDNWSLVVPEAMACGLPILCSKYNGCWPELVQSGKNGWVFDPLCPEELSKCLVSIVESRSSIPLMGGWSKRIVRGYSPVNAASSILRACEIAIEHSRRRKRVRHRI
jgi:glycosyltransferase involved in cell wall biosynthesis